MAVLQTLQRAQHAVPLRQRSLACGSICDLAKEKQLLGRQPASGRLYNGNSRDLANETSDTKTSGPKTRATLTSRCNPEKAAGLKPGATKEARPRQLVCVEVVVVFALGPLREFPLGNIDNP